MTVLSPEEEKYFVEYEKYILPLLYASISDNDEEKFLQLINDSIDIPILKEFVISAILDKIKLATKIIGINTGPNVAATRLIRTVCKLKSHDTLDVLESYFLKRKDFEMFFILLEEKNKAEINIESSKNAFLDLLEFPNHNVLIENINKFLEISNENHLDLVSYFLKNENVNKLHSYINLLAAKDYASLSVILPTIVSKFQGESGIYYNMVKSILAYSNKHLALMIDDNNFKFSHLEDKLLSSNILPMACAYYNNFNYELNNDRAVTFESKVIEALSRHALLVYVTHCQSANKRAVLKKLISYQDDDLIVQFFNLFPKYKNLITML